MTAPACGQHTCDGFNQLWCGGTPVPGSHLGDIGAAGFGPVPFLDIIDEANSRLWDTGPETVTVPPPRTTEAVCKNLAARKQRLSLGGDLPASPVSYAQLKAIAAGWSPQAECLARVTQDSTGLTFAEDLTDSDTAAATTVTDGDAQYVLVCVPVTPELAAEAARRRDEGAPTEVTVTVTADLAAGL